MILSLSNSNQGGRNYWKSGVRTLFPEGQTYAFLYGKFENAKKKDKFFFGLPKRGFEPQMFLSDATTTINRVIIEYFASNVNTGLAV